MADSAKRPVSLYLESNPNPNSLKFVANFMLVPEGQHFDYPDAASAVEAPLALELFSKFDYVERVFFMNNFVTVTKSESVEWAEVQTDVRTYISEFLADNIGFVVSFEEADALAQEGANDSELIQKIKTILDEYIKPAVEQDGGAISFHSYQEEDKRVKLLLQGSCSGCPSSTITLKSGIENLLKRMLPDEVAEVEAEGV
ncbi:MAG TPA: NifU family protein [Cytophagales bacterium]|nr:NifU family protein [Cytophagales bacterium]HAA23683.1 NifU family protein [Cytophagales bacterium]HAP59241.1 NifU family protein [Cytophagales bacterium]